MTPFCRDIDAYPHRLSHYTPIDILEYMFRSRLNQYVAWAQFTHSRCRRVYGMIARVLYTHIHMCEYMSISQLRPYSTWVYAIHIHCRRVHVYVVIPPALNTHIDICEHVYMFISRLSHSAMCGYLYWTMLSCAHTRHYLCYYVFCHLSISRCCVRLCLLDQSWTCSLTRDIIVGMQSLATATHCNTLQHITTHCNTLQHTAVRCSGKRLHTKVLSPLDSLSRTLTLSFSCSLVHTQASEQVVFARRRDIYKPFSRHLQRILPDSVMGKQHAQRSRGGEVGEGGRDGHRSHTRHDAFRIKVWYHARMYESRVLKTYNRHLWDARVTIHYGKY